MPELSSVPWCAFPIFTYHARTDKDFRPDEGRSSEFGVCAGCHTSHEAGIEKGLIAFSPPPPRGEGNREDMFCLHCHLDPRLRKDRPLHFYVHPTGSEVMEKLREQEEQEQGEPLEMPAEPILDRTMASFGALNQIRCVTCHDNHRWTDMQEEAQPLSGTEMTSFLKGSTVAETFCANCHGMEALYRYSFYHQDRAFRQKTPNE